ncbi:MAG: TIM barrel protein [Chloroflexi bacterium]|nr:MAG: TIM barrel protein [Chloroflexota bacterium]
MGAISFRTRRCSTRWPRPDTKAPSSAHGRIFRPIQRRSGASWARAGSRLRERSVRSRCTTAISEPHRSTPPARRSICSLPRERRCSCSPTPVTSGARRWPAACHWTAPHVASYVERPEEIARLMRDTDPALVGLCLDTGHIAYGGGDPVEIARTHARRVRHVHLKDLRREVRADVLARHLGFRDAVSLGVFAPLGDGSLDLRGALGTLREAGYGGWLIVEQDVRLGVSPIAAPLRDAKRSRAYLTEVLAA